MNDKNQRWKEGGGGQKEIPPILLEEGEINPRLFDIYYIFIQILPAIKNTA